MCFVVTDSLSLVLLGDLPRRMVAAGADVFVVSSPGARLDEEAHRQGFTALPVTMHRRISPGRDLVSIFRLIRVLRRVRPDLVDAATPKGGLLGMIAARFARMPTAIYTMRGLRLETEEGAKRRVLLLCERTAARLATEVLVISPSLRRRVVELRVAPEAKLRVLGPGSLRGVDLDAFAPTPAVLAAASRHRDELGLDDEATVIGFVGRLCPSKGITELLDAFDLLRSRHDRAHLLVIGDIDEAEPIRAVDQARLATTDRVHHVRWSTAMPAWFATMDFVALPTKREGFPSVPLEAAGLRKPCVAFRATGTVDAVVDGQTGVLVAPGDVTALADAFSRYLDDPGLVHAHGRAAHERAVAEFSADVTRDRHGKYLLDHLRGGGRAPTENL